MRLMAIAILVSATALAFATIQKRGPSPAAAPEMQIQRVTGVSAQPFHSSGKVTGVNSR